MKLKIKIIKKQKIYYMKIIGFQKKLKIAILYNQMIYLIFQFMI